MWTVGRNRNKAAYYFIGEIMEKYMNKPVNWVFTDEDIIKEYQRFNDIKRVAAAFCLDNKTVRQILKKEGEL
jgi:hypothetical protein